MCNKYMYFLAHIGMHGNADGRIQRTKKERKIDTI